MGHGPGCHLSGVAGVAVLSLLEHLWESANHFPVSYLQAAVKLRRDGGDDQSKLLRPLLTMMQMQYRLLRAAVPSSLAVLA